MTDPTLAALTEALEALRWYGHAPDLDTDIGRRARSVLPDLEEAIPAMADLARKAAAWDDHRTRCHNNDPDGVIAHLHAVNADLARKAAIGEAVERLPMDHVVRVYEADDGEPWWVVELAGDPIADGPTLDAAIAAALAAASPEDER